MVEKLLITRVEVVKDEDDEEMRMYVHLAQLHFHTHSFFFILKLLKSSANLPSPMLSLFMAQVTSYHATL